MLKTLWLISVGLTSYMSFALDVRYVEVFSRATVNYQEIQTESVQSYFPENYDQKVLAENLMMLKKNCDTFQGVLAKKACVFREFAEEKKTSLGDGYQIEGTLHQWVKAYCRVDRDLSSIPQILMFDYYRPDTVKNFSDCIRREGL